MSDYTREAELAIELARVRAERDALAAHVERMGAVIDGYYDDEDVAGEDALYDLRCIQDEDPTTSLARLRAEWQAEALEAVARRIRSTARNVMHGHALHLAADVVGEGAAELRRQAEDSP